MKTDSWAKARTAARGLEEVGRRFRPFFERYRQSLSNAELDEQGWELQKLIDHLDTLENQASNVVSALSKGGKNRRR